MYATIDTIIAGLLLLYALTYAMTIIYIFVKEEVWYGGKDDK